MKILNKQIISAYASVILDIIAESNSLENTKNIYETLKELSSDWNTLYSNGSDGEKEFGKTLEKTLEIARVYYFAGEPLTMDDDDFYKGMLFLIAIANEY